ncbi:MAG: hypothetical protein SF162_16570 [bacterium]|nr:hypothetical protein [bacterium]
MTNASRLPYAHAADLPSNVQRPRTPVGCAAWLFGRVLVAAALIAILVIGGHGVRLFIDHARIALEYPYTLNYGEGPLLDQAARLQRGGALYPLDLTQPPYTITNYPPVYVMLQAPFVATYGAAFWYGRLIALVATAAAAVCIAGIVIVLFRDGTAGVCAGLAFISLPYVLHWSALARIDSLALAFSLGGLFVIAWKPDRWWAVAISLCLLAAAAYTRQSYLLAGPLAACGWLWGRVSPMRGVAFGVAYAALILGIFIPLLVATEGGVFFHLITANVNLLDSRLVSYYADELIRWLPILLIGGGAWLIAGWIGRGHAANGTASAWWLVAPYLVGGLASALTISKVGSDVNYLYELLAALCIAAGAWIGRMRRLPALKAALIGALALQMVWAVGLSDAKYFGLIGARIEQRRAGNEQLAAVIDRETAPILADEHMGLLTLAGKPILLQPFELTQLAVSGVWDETPLLDAMARGEYPVVLMYNPMMNPDLRMERWSPGMRRVINQYYRVEAQAAETLVYRYWER